MVKRLLMIFAICLLLQGCTMRPQLSGSYYGTPSSTDVSVFAGVNF